MCSSAGLLILLCCMGPHQALMQHSRINTVGNLSRFIFFDSCGFTSQAPPGPLHSAVRSCCNTPRPTIFEPDLTGGTGLGSSHSVVRSCSDTPEPTIFEPDLTGGTGWVPCILLCIHLSIFPNQSSLSLISLVAQVWVPRMPPAGWKSCPGAICTLGPQKGVGMSGHAGPSIYFQVT